MHQSLFNSSLIYVQSTNDSPFDAVFIILCDLIDSHPGSSRGKILVRDVLLLAALVLLILGQSRPGPRRPEGRHLLLQLSVEGLRIATDDHARVPRTVAVRVRLPNKVECVCVSLDNHWVLAFAHDVDTVSSLVRFE